MLTASFLRSAFNWPGNLDEKTGEPRLKKMFHLKQVVTPDIVMETRWLRSPYVGEVSFNVLISNSSIII